MELIGTNYDAIACAQDRELFGAAMQEAGLRMPASAIATGWDKQAGRVDVTRGLAEALAALPEIGLPCIVRQLPAHRTQPRGKPGVKEFGRTTKQLSACATTRPSTAP